MAPFPRVVAVIPARWGSTRFPGKPLAELGGMSMIARTVQQVRKVRNADLVAVATDDPRIEDAVRKDAKGTRCVITPKNCATGTDRVLMAARNMGLARDDIVVNVQGDEPFINPLHVESLIDEMIRSPDTVMGTIAVKDSNVQVLQDPNSVKVIIDKNSDAMYFSRFPIPYCRDIASTQFPFLRHIGLYAFRFHFMEMYTSLPSSKLEHAESLEQLRVMEAGYKIKVVEVNGPVSPGIDTKEQLEAAEKYLERKSSV